MAGFWNKHHEEGGITLYSKDTLSFNALMHRHKFIVWCMYKAPFSICTVIDIIAHFTQKYYYSFVYPLSYPEINFSSVQFSRSVMSDSVTPWIVACQASLSIINFQSSFKLMCIKSVVPSSHLTLCRPLLLLPSIPPSIRVFSNESALHIRWPKF